MEEFWKDVKGFEGVYQVSNLGRVKSVRRNIILKNSIARNGYKRVLLCTNNIQKNYYIHRLVAMAFIPNPNNYPIVNHKDENPQNNSVGNLEWCTQKYNINYGTGIAKRARSRSKKVLQFKTDGTFIKEWGSTMDVERNLGFNHTHISACCRNIIKTAYGFIWKYAE